MAREKINRMEALKAFVTSLKEKYPDAKSFDRKMVLEVANDNQIGWITFATKYGYMTRLSRGTYIIPTAWEKNAPWATKAQTASANE